MTIICLNYRNALGCIKHLFNSIEDGYQECYEDSLMDVDFLAWWTWRWSQMTSMIVWKNVMQEELGIWTDG